MGETTRRGGRRIGSAFAEPTARQDSIGPMRLIGPPSAQPITNHQHLSPFTSHREAQSAAGGQRMQSASQFSHEVRSGSGGPAIMGVLFVWGLRYSAADYRLCPAAYAFFGARASFHGCHRLGLSTGALHSGYFHFTGCDCLPGLLVY
jgi:hypothetical protein